jgi:hypothetical protein
MRSNVLSKLGVFALITTSLFWQTTKAQDSTNNSYKNIEIINERYYNQSVISEPSQVHDSTLNINNSNSVTPTYCITEKPLAGIDLCDVEIKNKEPTYSFTDKEIKILHRITEAECTGQSLESKMNVCSVIINRVESDEFPNDIESVVFQTKPSVQFSPISDNRYYEVEIDESTIKAVNKVIQNGVINDALFFCNVSDVESLKSQKWFSKLEYLFKDDSGHSFYK